MSSPINTFPHCRVVLRASFVIGLKQAAEHVSVSSFINSINQGQTLVWRAGDERTFGRLQINACVTVADPGMGGPGDPQWPKLIGVARTCAKQSASDTGASCH